MLRVALTWQRPQFSLHARFEAATPGIIALFGRSGSGKTTLVNLIAGLLAPDAGEVSLDGEVLTDTQAGISVPAERRRIGYVFQNARLFPHLNVAGNLRYGAKRARAVAPFIRFDEVVALLGLEPLLTRRTHQLSGGERQRVALARALLSQPRLLLLDEPLASVDVARREEVLPYLEALRDRLEIPMVYVSHQFEEVLRLATHLVLIEAGEVLAQGTVGAVSLAPQLQRIVGPDHSRRGARRGGHAAGCRGWQRAARRGPRHAADQPARRAARSAGAPAGTGARCDPRDATGAGLERAQRPSRHGRHRQSG